VINHSKKAVGQSPWHPNIKITGVEGSSSPKKYGKIVGFNSLSQSSPKNWGKGIGFN
jgi:hypothetical protein